MRVMSKEDRGRRQGLRERANERSKQPKKAGNMGVGLIIFLPRRSIFGTKLQPSSSTCPTVWSGACGERLVLVDGSVMYRFTPPRRGGLSLPIVLRHDPFVQPIVW